MILLGPDPTLRYLFVYPRIASGVGPHILPPLPGLQTLVFSTFCRRSSRLLGLGTYLQGLNFEGVFLVG